MDIYAIVYVRRLQGGLNPIELPIESQQRNGIILRVMRQWKSLAFKVPGKGNDIPNNIVKVLN